ncbi:hypothetical protein EDB83DRAFT_1943089 [Lactarius deliciosus]|nr:hypothetical protein EDB83DRAFT_1943089 [Lactarius deliciosus]
MLLHLRLVGWVHGVLTPPVRPSSVPFSWYPCDDRRALRSVKRPHTSRTAYTRLPFSAREESEDGVLADVESTTLRNRLLRLNSELLAYREGPGSNTLICLTYLGFEIWEYVFQYFAAIHGGRGIMDRMSGEQARFY